jgi:hypothetical protein
MTPWNERRILGLFVGSLLLYIAVPEILDGSTHWRPLVACGLGVVLVVRSVMAWRQTSRDVHGSDPDAANNARRDIRATVFLVLLGVGLVVLAIVR